MIDTGRKAKREHAPQAPVKVFGLFWRILVIALLAVSLLTIVARYGWTNAAIGFAISSAGLIVGQILISFDSKRPHLLSLISLVTLSHALLFVLRPGYSLLYQGATNIFTGRTYGEEFLFASVVAATGYLSLCLGYRSRNDVQNRALAPRAVRPVEPEHWSVLSPILWAIVFAGFGLYGMYILQVGPGRWWSAISGGRSGETQSIVEGYSAYLYSANEFAFGALIFLALQAGITRRLISLAWIGSLLVVACFPAIALGSRSIFIPLFISLVYTIYLVYPRILKFRVAVIWMPLAFVGLIIAPRIWRNSSSSDGRIASSFMESFSFEAAVNDFLGGFDTAMIDALAIQVQAQTERVLEFTYGSSYGYLLSGIVPRVLWPEKPVPIDMYLNSELFPVTFAQGTGFAFSVYSEPYLSAGLIGVVLVNVLAGYVLATISIKCVRTNTVPYAYVLIMVASYLFPIMRGSISFDVQRLLIPLMPVLIALALSALYLQAGAKIRHRSRPPELSVVEPVEALPGGRADER